MRSEYKYGYFNEDGTEFTVTNPGTPRAFDNFIWNDAAFSNIQQTGTGYFDYQPGDKEAVQLLTGVGRICDFDVFGRDHLMSRIIYIRDNETRDFWTVNWEPVKHPYEDYACTHGLGYTIIGTTVNGIQAEFRIFIPLGNDAIELWTLNLVNKSSKKRDLSVFVYNQFQFKYKWGFDSYGDMIFRGSWFNKELNSFIASKHPYYRPHDFLTGFVTSDYPVTAFDGTRDSFVGMYNTLKEPSSVVNGKCTNTPGCSDATIGALQFNLDLAMDDGKKISMILGVTDKEEHIPAIKEKYFGHFDALFAELQKKGKKQVEQNKVHTPDAQFNRMLNVWLKQAVAYGAKWCRWGWNGYRDIVQHGLGIVTINPDRTKEILLEALQYQYKHGPALRGWNPVDEKSYSDSALWLVFTLTAYIKETGDIKILDIPVAYYDGSEATVLEHIQKALDFLENNKGSHRLCLIKFGDWNDSLTAVGKKGSGESVWLSQAYAAALLEMADLFNFLKNRELESSYLNRYESMKEAINKHAWNGDWYIRCFDDDGRPVGSKENTYGRIFLNSQSWSIISGIADRNKYDKIVNSCDNFLLTPNGYKVLAPTFLEEDDNIGRISCLEPGVCENGTIYSHVNIWMILALIRSGQPDKAYDIFKRITPGYINQSNKHKENCHPFMYANCYYGEEHRNNRFQMEFTWITGSVAWYNHVLINDFIGAKATYKGLKLSPCLPSSWKKVSITRKYRGSKYHIEINNNSSGNNKEVYIDMKKSDDCMIPIFTDGKEHNIVMNI